MEWLNIASNIATILGLIISIISLCVATSIKKSIKILNVESNETSTTKKNINTVLGLTNKEIHQKTSE